MIITFIPYVFITSAKTRDSASEKSSYLPLFDGDKKYPCLVNQRKTFLITTSHWTSVWSILASVGEITRSVAHLVLRRASSGNWSDLVQTSRYITRYYDEGNIIKCNEHEQPFERKILKSCVQLGIIVAPGKIRQLQFIPLELVGYMAC